MATRRSNITFADVVHQSLSFSPEIPSDALVLELIDNPWVQRLRDISQTANTRLVYMFSEHSRFGHSLGVCYLADLVMQKLSADYSTEVALYKEAIAAAALLHDLGHLAPGSHTAYKTWFPNGKDDHEAVAARIIKEDSALAAIISKRTPTLVELVCRIIMEDPSLPPWTWQIISGGGWNVDRGNWTIVDSVMAGVSYGKYNIPALIESMILSDSRELALRENRIDAMIHFAVSRHAMYRQLYQHRVLLAADCLNRAIVQRARDLGEKLTFADHYMHEALQAKSSSDLSLKTIFAMRESWWRYHLMRWSEGEDRILADLCKRLLDRRLLKTIRIRETDSESELLALAETTLKELGLDARYYLHVISTQDMHAGDHRQSMLVAMDDGQIKNLFEAEPLFGALVTETKGSKRIWLALPAEAKQKMGRGR